MIVHVCLTKWPAPYDVSTYQGSARPAAVNGFPFGCLGLRARMYLPPALKGPLSCRRSCVTNHFTISVIKSFQLFTPTVSPDGTLSSSGLEYCTGVRFAKDVQGAPTTAEDSDRSDSEGPPAADSDASNETVGGAADATLGAAIRAVPSCTAPRTTTGRHNARALRDTI